MNFEALIDRLADRIVERLNGKPKPKPKRKAPAVPAREPSELERVQRHFEFLREHGGILAEGRMNRDGGFDWRFRR